jgi:predicted ArsR family transcriptional regulator
MPKNTIPADKVLAGKTRTPTAPTYRAGSKRARLVELLNGPKGVTVDHLSSTLGWLTHTTRAALTGLRKDGHGIEKLPASDGESVSRYRIAKGGAA